MSTEQRIIFCILVFILVAVWLKKSFTKCAFFGAVVLLFGIFSWHERALLVMIFAFALTAVVEKICRKKLRYADENLTQKAGARDIIQLFVNGFCAFLSVFLYTTYQKEVFLWVYVVAVSESLQDSVSSTTGIAFQGKTIDICTFRPITKGLSGGVSLYGTLSGVVSSVLLSAVAVALRIAEGKAIPFIVLSSTVGCLADSFFGSAWQVKYTCPICGTVTEKKTHCFHATVYRSGWKRMNNDVVNFLSNLVACAVCVGLYYWFQAVSVTS